MLTTITRFNPVQLLGEGLTITFLRETGGRIRTVLGLAIDDDLQRYRLETCYAPPADPARTLQRPPIDELSGEGIEAGEGIKAGFHIHAKFIDCKLRILAGLVNWRMPEPSETEIHAVVRRGTVALGTVIEQPEK